MITAEPMQQEGRLLMTGDLIHVTDESLVGRRWEPVSECWVGRIYDADHFVPMRRNTRVCFSADAQREPNKQDRFVGGAS